MRAVFMKFKTETNDDAMFNIHQITAIRKYDQYTKIHIGNEVILCIDDYEKVLMRIQERGVVLDFGNYT